MSQSSKPVAVAISAAVATGTLLAGSVFSMQTMASGYMQDAAAHATDKAHHEGGCGMAKMDTDQDGRLSRAEFNAAHKGSEEKFASHDGNGDGFITQAEMDARHAEMKKAAPAGKGKMEGKCGEGKCGEGKCGGKS